jgi:hypothetical protein
MSLLASRPPTRALIALAALAAPLALSAPVALLATDDAPAALIRCDHRPDVWICYDVEDPLEGGPIRDLDI